LFVFNFFLICTRSFSDYFALASALVDASEESMGEEGMGEEGSEEGMGEERDRVRDRERERERERERKERAGGQERGREREGGRGKNEGGREGEGKRVGGMDGGGQGDGIWARGGRGSEAKGGVGGKGRGGRGGGDTRSGIRGVLARERDMLRVFDDALWRHRFVSVYGWVGRSSLCVKRDSHKQNACANHRRAFLKSCCKRDLV
jgi:hypothetical protein